MIEPSMLTAQEVRQRVQAKAYRQIHYCLSTLLSSGVFFYDNYYTFSLRTLFQIDWLNDYHSTVMEKVGECLAASGKHHVLKWLERETQPLG